MTVALVAWLAMGMGVGNGAFATSLAAEFNAVSAARGPSEVAQLGSPRPVAAAATPPTTFRMRRMGWNGSGTAARIILGIIRTRLYTPIRGRQGQNTD